MSKHNDDFSSSLDAKTIELIEALEKYKKHGHRFKTSLKPLYLPEAITALGDFLQDFLEHLPKAWELGLQNWSGFNLNPFHTRLNQIAIGHLPRLIRFDFTMVAGKPQIFEIEHNPGGLGLTTAFQKAWKCQQSLADYYHTYIDPNPYFILTNKDADYVDYMDASFFLEQVSGNTEQIYLLGELKENFFQGKPKHIHRYHDPYLIDADINSPLRNNLSMLLQAWQCGQITLEPPAGSLMSKLGIASIFSQSSVWEEAGLNLQLARSIVPEIRLLSEIDSRNLKQKESVIKVLTPEISYRSMGVKIGCYEETTEWNNWVDQLCTNQTPSVVQRYVEHYQEILPFVEEYYSDTSYVVKQEKFDLLCRAYFIKSNDSIIFASGYYFGRDASTNGGKVSGGKAIMGPIFNQSSK